MCDAWPARRPALAGSLSMATFVARRAVDDIKRSFGYYEVWFFLALDDIFSRYRNTVLGPVWNAAYIVAQAVALSLVFGGVFGQSLGSVMPFILTGLVAWSLGPATIIESSGLLLWFAGTIKTQSFPFLFYAFRVVARSCLMFLHNLAALLLVLPLFGHIPFVNIAIIPAIVLTMFISAPLCLMLGMICARFRDFQMFVANFSNILFFMTPIFWTAEKATGMRRLVVAYNPFYYMVDIIRKPLLNTFPPMQDWIICGGIALFAWALCFICLSTYRARIPYWV
jgi:lipopolysaccharide transport system permease protein